MTLLMCLAIWRFLRTDSGRSASGEVDDGADVEPSGAPSPTLDAARS
jgi:hypothetical protein